MALLRLLRFGKILMHIFDVDEGPGQVVTRSDALDPSGLGGKARCAVEVPDRLLCALELVEVVDSVASVGIATRLDVCGDGG